MQTKHIALSLLALTILPACGAKKKSKAQSPIGVQFFVHGDPKNLYAGSTPDATSFLTLENMSQFNGFHLSSEYAFVEKEELVNPKDWDQVEDQNKTDDGVTDEELFGLTTYNFENAGRNRVSFQPSGDGQTFGFAVDASGRLNLTDVDGFPVVPVHYSLKNDKRAFSVLATYLDPKYGKGIYEIVFSTSEETKTVERSNKDFAYLFDNIKVKWDEEISIDLCGNYTQEQKDSVEKSVAAWFTDPLKLAGDPYTGVRLGFKTTFKPFSDLNEHCIQLVNNFKLENSTNFYTAGVTLPVFNLAAKSQIDSDIFIFTNHTPVANELRNGFVSETTTHEVGHFFGLGHEFKEDEKGQALYPSIMGYSKGASTITQRDFEAIQALYGQSLGLAADPTTL